MRKLFLLTFIAIQFQAFGQNVELMDVIQDFIIDENASYNVQSWNVTDNKNYKVIWENKDITWDDKSESYYKSGSIEILIEREYFGWTMLIMGPRAGVTKVIFYHSNDQRLEKIDIENLFGKRDIEGTFIKCDNNTPTFGFESWVIEPIDKQKAWLSYEWSCGSAGCSAEVILYYADNEIRGYECN